MPDFFLIGAQKAGTTTLAAMLDEVPGVAMSRPKEPMLFCFDDYSVHQSEFLHPDRMWTRYTWARDRETMLASYAACFRHAGEGQIRGEASTTYAPSVIACRRLSETCPNAKFIMTLRDPVKRAYSSYWHGIRSGVFTQRFEDEVRFGSGLLLRFGHYEEQLRRYMAGFGKDRIHVIHFEDLLGSPGRVMEQLLTFLGVPFDRASLPELPKLNESFYPRWPGAHRRVSALLRRMRDHTPHSSLAFLNEHAGVGETEPATSAAVPSWAKRIYRRLSMTERVPSRMAPETRKVLQEHFRRENEGLSDLLGVDVFQRWSWKD